MRLLVVGHAYTVHLNRGKWRAFRRLDPAGDLLIVVPEKWPNAFQDRPADPPHDLPVRALPAGWIGIEGRHFYRSGLGRLIAAFRPDVIHVEQGSDALVYAQTLWLARRARLRPRTGFFTWMNLDLPRSWKVRMIERYNLRRTDYAVCGNVDAESLLRRRGFDGPVLRSAQLGVDPTFFAPADGAAAKRALGWPSKPVVGFVGRFVEEKGVADLIDAWASLRREGLDCGLALLGAGEAEASFRARVAATGASADARFLPPCGHDDVLRFVHAMDALALPSRSVPFWKEQFGHVLIEAMSCGVPVVGSDSGGIPEVIGEAGLVFPEGNVAALSAALRSVLFDAGARGEWGRRGRERVSSHFTDDALARQLHEFLTRRVFPA